MKSFGDLGFVGHSDARYTPPKWAKNQFRVLLSNAWNRGSEPEPSEEQYVQHEAFMNMLAKTLGHVSDDDKMAVLKRFVVVIVGVNAIYVRAPSELADTPICRFSTDNVMQDFLQDP
eukprot:2038418-Karenia_brevis.AAC.1